MTRKQAGAPIDTDGPTILDARASLNIFAICEAALDSNRTGQPVTHG